MIWPRGKGAGQHGGQVRGKPLPYLTCTSKRQAIAFILPVQVHRARHIILDQAICRVDSGNGMNDTGVREKMYGIQRRGSGIIPLTSHFMALTHRSAPCESRTPIIPT